MTTASTTKANKKTKGQYRCTACDATASKWAGQCTTCQAWNTLEETVAPDRRARSAGYAAATTKQVQRLSEVESTETARLMTHLSELDRVLGGGLVVGGAVLIGGDPGIGKSTLLLQTLCAMSQEFPALYVTGEESLQQVSLRASRLGLPQDQLQVLAETRVESILAIAQQQKPKIIVIDSIQTSYTEQLSSMPGSVSQLRESTGLLVSFAKQTQTSIFLVGHVTKEGTLAGPRVLEHMVDTVLYFEGDNDNPFRLIRAVKNRFGAINELGVFAMTDKGLREVSNPSAIFLSREISAPGSVVMITREGSRPLLVEVQALVDESHLANPRRVSVGIDSSRLAMCLAVLHRHGDIPTFDQDVFVNVVGGVRVTETGVDLALMLAVLSSLRNHALPSDLVVFGEVGLAGEIRPVQNGQDRLREAAKHGFKHAIIPKANAPRTPLPGMQCVPVSRLSEALQACRELMA